jgi:hypothetical protein
MIAGAQAVLWLRLDETGNEACRFAETGPDLLISGSVTAQGQPTIRYRVRAVNGGATIRARVHTPVPLVVQRTAKAGWSLNDHPVDGLDDALDVDLGFSPATNTLAIRRLALNIGAEKTITAARLDPADWTLKPLRQTYARTGENSYRYTSPDTGFSVDLTTDSYGIVDDYPGFWHRQTT